MRLIPCRKVKHCSKTSALAALTRMKEGRGRRGGKSKSKYPRVRAYPCPLCGFWHLGKRIKKEKRDG